MGFRQKKVKEKHETSYIHKSQFLYLNILISSQKWH